ncbi:MAG: glycosyltransferase family 2 protein [bacterium]
MINLFSSLQKNIRKAYLVFKHQGLKNVFFKTFRYIRKHINTAYSTNLITDIDYGKWFAKDIENRYQEAKNIKLEKNPKISVLIPVYNTLPNELEEAIESVKSQFYTNWELCIADDCSTSQATKDVLKKYEGSDPRIIIKYREKNGGISQASNSIIEFVSGDYTALMDNDDLITKDALLLIAKKINEDEKINFLYTDEDLLTTEDQHIKPHFKPDWSKYHAECTMYPLHMCVYKTSLLKKLGGFRDESKGTQDWDLLLRAMSEKDFHAAHISKVIYSWRLTPTSTSVTMMTKPYVIENQKKTLTNYMALNNIDGDLKSTEIQGVYRIKRKIKGNPLISVIILTKDKLNLLKDAVDSVLNNSYKNFELIIVSNNSKEKETLDYLQELAKIHSNVIFFEHNVKFNFSELNNVAAEKAKGDYLLFLNNDVKSINDEWIESMLEYAQLPDVGVVGSKLIFGNKTIQHAGIVYGTDTGVSNVMVGFPYTSPGYNFYLQTVRHYSAVIGACFMVKKEDFVNMGMFDLNLGLIHQETDFCFRIQEQGKYVIFTPYSLLFHFESSTRGNEPVNDTWLKNQEYFEKKWKDKLSKPDPYYNPNLSKKNANYTLGEEQLKIRN